MAALRKFLVYLLISFVLLIFSHVLLIEFALATHCCSRSITQFDASGHFRLGVDWAGFAAIGLLVALWALRRGRTQSAKLAIGASLVAVPIFVGALRFSATPNAYATLASRSGWYSANLVFSTAIVTMALALGILAVRRRERRHEGGVRGHEKMTS